VLLSGGIDSAAALYLTKATRQVRALTFEYHKVARRELESARAIGAGAGVLEHRFVSLPDLKEAEAIGSEFGNLPPTYIPLRNSIFYSFAASYAEESGATLIVGGHNRDDGEVFQDVSSDFFRALEAAFRASSLTLRRGRLRISRPLQAKSKPEVVKLAASLHVPLEKTWSCHRSGRDHCWKCEGCLTRKRAFEAAGVADPLVHK
jgi:7-cyano-7-deazaguanine synthase